MVKKRMETELSTSPPWRKPSRHNQEHAASFWSFFGRSHLGPRQRGQEVNTPGTTGLPLHRPTRPIELWPLLLRVLGKCAFSSCVLRPKPVPLRAFPSLGEGTPWSCRLQASNRLNSAKSKSRTKLWLFLLGKLLPQPVFSWMFWSCEKHPKHFFSFSLLLFFFFFFLSFICSVDL